MYIHKLTHFLHVGWQKLQNATSYYLYTLFLPRPCSQIIYFYRIVKGIPKPAIRWSFKRAGTTAFSAMMESTETVHLNNVLKEQTGTYKCSAENALGSDSFTMEIIVECKSFFPLINKPKRNYLFYMYCYVKIYTRMTLKFLGNSV